MRLAPAGTYEALENSARYIANPALHASHFVLERLTEGGWDNLGGEIPIPVRQHLPTMWKDHFPTRQDDGMAA